MYLKSIEIQGFKSFAHKMKLDFHNGITGIVGPNGSGKSNVADAVRWVLGEQRIKQLRGGSMQDVIFSGTENRKPLSFASVAITLDNSDHQLATSYEEVTVTRKLYRSGESDYLLNGNSCRLKDINELFYDTGIGKEGYSIIGQGQVDKILSGKPEDRRELFDEAAGIVKFKRRKDASIKKLQDEKANLLRVSDILSELELQVGPLEKQAAKAKDYLTKRDELKEYDINSFLLENARIKGQVSELLNTLQISKDELEENSSKKDKMKAEYKAVEEQLEEMEGNIDIAKNQLNESSLLRQQLEGQIELLKEQIKSAKQSDEHFEERKKAIELDINTRNEVLTTLKKEENKLSEKLVEKKKLEDNVENDLLSLHAKVTKIAGDIENNKSEILKLLGNRTSTSAQIQKFDTMLEQHLESKKNLSVKIKDTSKEIDDQKSSLVKHEAVFSEVNGVIETKKTKILSLENSIRDLEIVLKEKNESFSLGQKTYLREQSRLDSLKNITERYEGYGNSIRKVMDEKSKEKGILGVVADIIKVNKDYEVAIETALGGSIQNIVTDNEGTAKKMISFLKVNKFGRATFLPLTSVKAYKGISNDKVLSESGVIGVASKLTKVEKKYEELCESLLGRTIVVDNIDTGVLLAKKHNQSLRLVTLEGELINLGGSMTGGAFKNKSHLLSRRREIESFEKSVALLKTEMDELEKEVSELKSKKAKSFSEIDQINEILKQDYVEQNTAKISLESTKARIDRLSERIADYKTQLDESEKQISDIYLNQESIRVELETSEQLEIDLNERNSSYSKDLESFQEQEKEKQKESENIHLNYASIEQEKHFNNENIVRIEGEIVKFNADLDELKDNKSGAAKEIEAKENEINSLLKTIDDSKELFTEIEQEIVKQKETRDNLNKKNKTFLQKRDDLTTHIAELDKEIYRLETRKDSLDASLEKQIEYMWEEYEITFSTAKEMKNENLTDLSKMKKRISELRSEIKALGDVNVNAIEDYKSVSERYEFLKTQHADLVEAEQTLMKIIEELDNSMRTQFNEQFSKIALEFDKVFKELFGGGRGTLELTEEEDVLEAGIKIIAQPPGKKLQNMMQLSGGEKALTAISLIFAIQNLKPSPFCLLDEIEAALDDSNVARFANYLHKLTKHTQFIVITHRRGTMTAADRLYGITMQEKGVSALVSVSLLENELEE
ncbi:MAG: chromosome segregation protein SMC [Suipraeoptans sp.]